MLGSPSSRNQDLEHLIAGLEVPASHYEKAVQRYTSIGEWLGRPESSVRQFGPRVSCQGSFSLGTATKPLDADGEYDLDAVVELTGLKHADMSQQQLKQLVGREVRLYAEARGVKAPVEERKRVWRLNYADDISFHVDILPAIPELAPFKVALTLDGVPHELAALALAITCKEHAAYAMVSQDWPHSNPGGFARWFVGRMRAVAQERLRRLVESRAYASVDAVPTFEWKTPLQRAVQILKRHRDVMFKDDPDGQPISVIITTLSAEAYAGEADVRDALGNILEKMPGLVRKQFPRVPNPVHKGEDFADKWRTNPDLEPNFWAWHAQAQADLARIGSVLSERQLSEHAEKAFGVRLPVPERPVVSVSARVVSAPVVISSPPKPWGRTRP